MNSCVLLLSGKGSRTKLDFNKIFYEIDQKPLFLYAFDTLVKACFDEYIITCKEDEMEQIKEYIDSNYSNIPVKYVLGGKERNESVANALHNVTGDCVFIHDGARPLVSLEDVLSLKEGSKEYVAGTLYHPVTDTIKYVDNGVTTIDRTKLKAVSTPQFFQRECFDKIIHNTEKITDEIMLFEKDAPILFVQETQANIKLTTKEDIELIDYYLHKGKTMKVGHSLDYHPYEKETDKKLVLGGITFPDYPILKGHSDADVLIHAVTESLMGALGLGDLGTLFPDTDPKYKGIDSCKLLNEVLSRMKEMGYTIVNIDATVYCIKPNLKNFKVQMAANIKELTNAEYVNIKAATLNKGGLIALNEGIGAEAICLIKKC